MFPVSVAGVVLSTGPLGGFLGSPMRIPPDCVVGGFLEWSAGGPLDCSVGSHVVGYLCESPGEPSYIPRVSLGRSREGFHGRVPWGASVWVAQWVKRFFQRVIGGVFWGGSRDSTVRVPSASPGGFSRAVRCMVSICGQVNTAPVAVA
jgi:hypothetical protein